KNNIKFNVSTLIIYDNVYFFSYERTINRHQTLSISGGPMEFPKFSTLDVGNVKFERESKRSGYTIGAEYRFYLAKENKYAPPHGLYLGPYINYYRFNSQRNITFTDSSANQSTANFASTIDIFNLGVQIGYQFVLWKRLSIDLILFAPSLSKYGASFTYDGNINLDHQGQISQEVVDALKSRFPLLDKLISNGNVSASGTLHHDFKVWAPGLRYAVFLGYRFGP
ncbi:MAG: DUF3575 domain-containing protein, partial [Chitinophagales bacterium]